MSGHSILPQDTTHRSEAVSELKNNEANKTLADQSYAMREMVEKNDSKAEQVKKKDDANDVDLDEKKEKEQSKRANARPKKIFEKEDERSDVAKKFLGGQFFDSTI